MSRFIGMAEKVKEGFDGGDINKYIKKFASDHNLNNNEMQRLAEEVNVSSFLDKLREGKHYEDFQVVDPIVTHSNGESPVLENSELNKSASVKYNSVQSSMFDLTPVEINSESQMLKKTASSEINNEIMNSEEKWAEADNIRKEAIAEENAMMEKFNNELSMYESLSVLTKIANTSEGMTKTAASVLALNDLDELAVTMIENSKYSSFDIIEANAEELSKEAASALKLVLKKTAKNITKDTVDAAKAAGKLITYPVKHPVVGLGTVGGVAYASSNRIDKPDKDRMEMSLRSFKNGN